ncbi:MAG: hypothetical protein J0M12_16610, partial [Deltaproteobacteria bacterium]|nr:hypothetical protein [Deltaproteobacteria bacterium]
LSDRVVKKNPLLGPKYPNPRRVAHFVSAYDAYRRTLHVAFGYDSEQAELSALRVGIEGSRKRIDSEWKSGAPKYQVDSVRSQVKESLSTATEALNNGVNRHKVRAVELVARMVDSRDRTGRLNPRATSVVMERAERHLGSRLGEVRAKKSHNNTDESLLNEIINAEEAVLERFRVNLVEKADAVMLPKRESRLRLIVAAMRTKPAAEIMTELAPERAGLEDITARPFSTFAGLLRVGCLELEGALQRRLFKDAERAAVKLHIVTKLFSTNVNIERMKDCLVNPEFVPVDYMKREILGLRQVLKQHILAGVHVEEYEARFKALARQIDTLDSMLDNRPGLRASASDRKKYFRQVKATLDRIVPERLAWDLVPERWRKASGQEPTQKTPA